MILLHLPQKAKSHGLVTRKDNPEEFAKILEKHYKKPRTRLEIERDFFFSQVDPMGHDIDLAVDDSDVLAITGVR